MKKILAISTILFFMGIYQSYAANTVTIDGVAKDGVSVVITIQGTPNPTPVLIPTPTPTPTPSGVFGSLTNPIPINKKTTMTYNGYIPSISPANGRGDVTMQAYQKLYFVIDPGSGSAKSFRVDVQPYSGFVKMCKVIQDKATGVYSQEVCVGSDGYMDIVYDGQPDVIANKRFLYAIDSSQVPGAVQDSIWATIPFK